MASRRQPLFDAQREKTWQALDLGPSWTMRGVLPVAPTQSDEPIAKASEVAPAIAPAIAPATDSAGALDEAAVSVTPSGEPLVALPDQPSAPARNGTVESVAPAQMSWTQMQSVVTNCQACGLCQSRQQTVFGSGDEKPRWVIVGEAPGAQEDRLGEPFVGEAGQLLDAMLGAAGAHRGQGIYILNVLKCRPPGNRDPSPEEVSSCKPYLMRQLELLQPELIITMGRFAAQTVLQTDRGIGQLRSTVHQTEVAGKSVPVVAAYHPAYLLRSPEQKAKAWADLCLARSVCEPVD